VPIAPSKWVKRCARRSTEQRAESKARLLGKPRAAPPPALHTYTFPITTCQPLTIVGTFDFIASSLILGGNTLPLSTQTDQAWGQWTATNTTTTITWPNWNNGQLYQVGDTVESGATGQYAPTPYVYRTETPEEAGRRQRLEAEVREREARRARVLRQGEVHLRPRQPRSALSHPLRPQPVAQCGVAR
jgi:hypothetical protein